MMMTIIIGANVCEVAVSRAISRKVTRGHAVQCDDADDNRMWIDKAVSTHVKNATKCFLLTLVCGIVCILMNIFLTLNQPCIVVQLYTTIKCRKNWSTIRT